MGWLNTNREVEMALQERPYGLVLTCGFAGALNSALGVGTVVYGQNTPAGLSRVLSALGAAAVTFHCAERIASTGREKQLLRQTTGADAVEMESAGIHRVSLERNVDCATVRVISDGANEDLPLDFNALMTDSFRLNYSKLAWTLLKHPGKVPQLFKLQRHTRRAAESLGGVLAELLRQDALIRG